MLRISRSDTAKGIRKDPQFIVSFNALLWIHHVRIQEKSYHWIEDWGLHTLGIAPDPGGYASQRARIHDTLSLSLSLSSSWILIACLLARSLAFIHGVKTIVKVTIHHFCTRTFSARSIADFIFLWYKHDPLSDLQTTRDCAQNGCTSNLPIQFNAIWLMLISQAG